MLARKAAPVLTLILASHGAYAQPTPPKPAFGFIPQVWTGATIGGYTFDSKTKIDAIALSDSGAVAFTAHRENEGTGRDDTAVFTRDRLVVREGQTSGGKIIVRIATAAIAVNNANQVGFEALYRDPGHKELHGGIFVQDHFATEFEPSATGGATEFFLADDGMIRLHDGIMPTRPKPSILTNGMARALHRWGYTLLQKVIQGRPYVDVWGQSIDVIDATVWEKGAQTPQQKRSQSASAIITRSCPAPGFPFPSVWALGTSGGGPVAAHLFEDGSPSRQYDSPFLGHLKAPFRQIQFSAECAPLAIAIGDPAVKGKFEVHTSSGVLTYQQPDGVFAFPGFFQRVTSPSFLQSDAAWQINRRGDIILRVALDDGFAVLLAKPLAADR